MHENWIDNPEDDYMPEEDKTIKGKILKKLEEMEGDFNTAEAFVRPEEETETCKKILKARKLYDELYETVKSW